MTKQLFSGVTEQGKASIHRLDDAEILLENSRWRGAMYLAGYAVECLLKKKLMMRFSCRTLESLDRELSRRDLLPSRMSVFTHSFEPLFQLCDGTARLKHDAKTWRTFVRVNKWIPAWRYSSVPTSENEARTFVSAVRELVKWIEGNIG